MKFYDYFIKIISERLKERDTLPHLIEKIRKASEEGQIAFYPYGRLTRMIISGIKTTAPDIFPRILGCFDRSREVSKEDGIQNYHISEINKLKSKISLLVIASSTFYEHQAKEIRELTTYNGEMFNTSYFDISLPPYMGDKEITSKIKEVYSLLCDEKSKATYMVAWLSRILNDEQITSLFESEEKIDIANEPIEYKDYKIKGIDDTCKKELYSELYKTKAVSPEKGEVVFDIGAYKGDTAIFFASHVGREGKVYAFEPVKPNFNCLVNNIELNKLGNIIIPVNKGVSNKNGATKAVSVASGAPWSYLSDKGCEIEITTIDQFVNSNKINKLDFIKMDVEGFEEQAISGANKTIEKLKPKLAIAIYHKTTDLIKIPLMLSQINRYQFYIRSKIDGPFGFTLYCKNKPLD